MSPENCVYCDERPGTSGDHTPSENLFPKPRPNNLIKVPACQPCNVGFSKDEEYFRLILVYTQHGEKAPGFSWDKVERSLDRERSRLFDLLLESLKPDAELGVEVNVDHARIDRVLIKTMRGLSFHHLGLRLKEGDWSRPQTGPVDEMSRLAAPWLDNTPFREIGTPVFAYRFRAVEDPAFTTLWQMVFYQSLSCLIGIRRTAVVGI